MLKRSLFIAAAFGLFVVADAGCKKTEESTAPDEVAESTPKKKGVSEDNEDSMVSAGPSSSEGDGEAAPATTDMDAAVKGVEAAPPSPVRQPPSAVDTSSLNPDKQGIAVVRYHRALVLKALGRENDAQNDLDRARQLIGREPDEKLF